MKKRITLIVLTMAFLVMGASQAMAASFDVTSNYGILIPLGTTCDNIGEVRIEPKPYTSSFWVSPILNTLIPEEITIQLLLADKVCVTNTTPEPFDYDCYYTWNDTQDKAALVGVAGGTVPSVWHYRVFCNNGDTQIKVQINTIFAAGFGDAPATTAGVIAMFQRDETAFATTSTIPAPRAQYTTMCLDISQSPYNPLQPGSNRVEVSYSDITGNAYTGDAYVATLGGTGAGCTIEVGPCIKVPDTNLFYGYESLQLTKNRGAQGQEEYCEGGVDTICLKVEQPSGSSAFAGDVAWNVTVCETPDYADLWPVAIRVYDNEGVQIGGGGNGDPTATCITALNVHVDEPEDLPLQIQVDYANNCDTLPGTLYVTARFDKVGAACGVDCPMLTDDPLAFPVEDSVGLKLQAIFPYAPVPTNKWWVGMSLNNLVDHDIDVTLQVFEADGDEYTSDKITIPARGLRTGLFDSTVAGDLDLDGVRVNLKTTSGDTLFGDERFWVLATVDLGTFNSLGDILSINQAFSGFLMMGDGMQAQGYLPQGLNWLPSVLTENWDGVVNGGPTP